MCLSGCLLANDINSKAYINMTKSRWTIIQSSPASNPWSIPFISLECLLFWNGMSFLPVGLSSAFAKMMTRCDLRDLNTTFLSSKLCGEKSLLGRQIRRWLVGYRRNIYTDEWNVQARSWKGQQIVLPLWVATGKKVLSGGRTIF